MNIVSTMLYKAPCGELLLGCHDGKICLCDWTGGRRHAAALDRLSGLLGVQFRDGRADVLEEATRQLDGYFSRSRHAFDLPLAMYGTPFQLKVWSGLASIPYGGTVSYGDFAAYLGIPSSVRAVANANASNPLSIILPCHRVIGSDGSLTGYGGGIAVKRFLLDLEHLPERTMD